MKKIVEKFAKFVSHNHILVFSICIAFTVIAAIGTQLMETQDIDYQDMLPENYDVIKAFTLIGEDFGSTNSGTIVIYIDSDYPNSNEVTRITDPDVVRYSLTLENYFYYLDDVEAVNGFGQLVEETYGIVPNSLNDIQAVATSTYGTSYVSEDETMILISLSLSEDVDGEILTEEVSQLIDNIEKPAGISVELSGDVFEDVIVNETLSPDIQRTSIFSMIAIIIILSLLFKSPKGVAIPLMTIIFGIIWAFGFLGITGGGLSSMTSGSISMIMGIGIDFGIQIMSRFKQELKTSKKEIAMQKTLQGTLVPILTTALACLIGFRAMGLGELSMMGELGNIMSLGVLFCMLAAITIVPCLLLIFTKDKPKDSPNN